ncbi:MAG: HIT family protein [Chloroflexota bacterium]
MITHFCPNCWTETLEEEENCPACGCALLCFEQLPYEKKLIMALKHPVIQNRMIAIELLGQIGPEEDGYYEYYQLREVLLALARIDTPSTRALISEASSHRSMLIRKLAADLAGGWSHHLQNPVSANGAKDYMDEKEIVSRCIFCQDPGDKVVFSNRRFYAIYDAYPVNPGHLLIISRRHVPDLFGLDQEEFAAIHETLAEAKSLLDRECSPDGYNVGANCGEIAGQTIPHFHLHIIPRYKGDVDKPRGGIRNL